MLDPGRSSRTGLRQAQAERWAGGAAFSQLLPAPRNYPRYPTYPQANFAWCDSRRVTASSLSSGARIGDGTLPGDSKGPAAATASAGNLKAGEGAFTRRRPPTRRERRVRPPQHRMLDGAGLPASLGRPETAESSLRRRSAERRTRASALDARPDRKAWAGMPAEALRGFGMGAGTREDARLRLRGGAGGKRPVRRHAIREGRRPASAGRHPTPKRPPGFTQAGPSDGTVGAGGDTGPHFASGSVSRRGSRPDRQAGGVRSSRETKKGGSSRSRPSNVVMARRIRRG